MSGITRDECLRTHQILNEKMDKFTDKLGDIEVAIAGLPEKLAEKFDERYVSREKFEPVRKIVYGAVATVLLTVLGILLSLILKK